MPMPAAARDLSGRPVGAAIAEPPVMPANTNVSGVPVQIAREQAQTPSFKALKSIHEICEHTTDKQTSDEIHAFLKEFGLNNTKGIKLAANTNPGANQMILSLKGPEAAKFLFSTEHNKQAAKQKGVLAKLSGVFKRQVADEHFNKANMTKLDKALGDEALSNKIHAGLVSDELRAQIVVQPMQDENGKSFIGISEIGISSAPVYSLEKLANDPNQIFMLEALKIINTKNETSSNAAVEEPKKGLMSKIFNKKPAEPTAMSRLDQVKESLIKAYDNPKATKFINAEIDKVEKVIKGLTADKPDLKALEPYKNFFRLERTTQLTLPGTPELPNQVSTLVTGLGEAEKAKEVSVTSPFPQLTLPPNMINVDTPYNHPTAHNHNVDSTNHDVIMNGKGAKVNYDANHTLLNTIADANFLSPANQDPKAFERSLVQNLFNGLNTALQTEMQTYPKFQPVLEGESLRTIEETKALDGYNRQVNQGKPLTDGQLAAMQKGSKDGTLAKVEGDLEEKLNAEEQALQVSAEPEKTGMFSKLKNMVPGAKK
jgi:hypothetical protein